MTKNHPRRVASTPVVPTLILALALLLASCTPGAPPTPQQEGTPAAPPVVTVVQTVVQTVVGAPGTPAAPAATQDAVPASGSGKTATIAFVQDFDSLNPLYAQALSSIYTQPIYTCRPWDFDEKGSPIPKMVSEIPSLQNGGISQDGRVVTMKLRDDIVWSDGTPITAQDFVFTYQMITDADNGIAGIAPYDQVESVTAPDERTVVVTFKQPYAAWLSALWKTVLPVHILKPVYDSAGSIQSAEWNTAPTVGCGPFVFQSWQQGSGATFTANTRYWLGRPKLDTIQIRLVADDAGKLQALQSGQADLSVFLIDSAQYLPQLQSAGLQILPVDSGYNEGWFFYLDPTNGHPALQDVKVRQAIAYGLDRDRIIRELFPTGRQASPSYWSNSPYLDPSVTPWPYDPAKAKALLDEAGWVDSNGNGTRDKDGRELTLTFGTTTNTLRQQVQEAARAHLNEVGIGIEPLNFDSGVFFGGYNEGGPAATGQLDIFEYAPRTKNYPDPGSNDFLCSQIPSVTELGENWSWLCDEELDKLLQLQSTQIDFAQRQATFHQITKMIYENVYFLGLWSDPDVWAATPRLQNVRLSGILPLQNIAEWDVAQ